MIHHLPSLREIYKKMIREEPQQEAVDLVARQNTSSFSRQKNQFDSSRKNEAQNREDNSIMRSCALCSHHAKTRQLNQIAGKLLVF